MIFKKKKRSSEHPGVCSETEILYQTPPNTHRVLIVVLRLFALFGPLTYVLQTGSDHLFRPDMLLFPFFCF